MSPFRLPRTTSQHHHVRVPVGLPAAPRTDGGPGPAGTRRGRARRRWLHAVVHLPSSSADGTLPDPGRTVLLESGLGLSRVLWSRVTAPLTAAGFTVIVYDRAGLGQSPLARGRRTARDHVADLYTVLTHLAPRGAILVGHSYGGLLVRMLASEHPDQVTGLVLVDPSSEGSTAEASSGARYLNSVGQQVLTGLYGLGAAPLISLLQGYHLLPRRLHAKVLHEDATEASQTARGQELEAYSDTIADLGARPLPTPQVPVVLLAARHPAGSAWAGYYRDYVASLPQGLFRTARTRSHMVPLRDPGAVVMAVRWVWQRAGEHEACPRPCP